MNTPLLDGVKKTALRHVLITGPPGSGKTTLSEKMAEERNLPVLHGDGLKPPPGLQFPGTLAMREHLRLLKKPHIVEGSQLLGFNPEDLTGHELVVLNPGEKVLVERLVNRGWYDSTGKHWKVESSRKVTKTDVKKFQRILAEFNRRRRGGEP